MSNPRQDPSQPAAEDAEEHVETTVLPGDTGAALGAGAPHSGGSPGAAGQPDEELARVRAQAEENWNKYLRAVAELDNARKRAARDIERARNFGIEGLAAELLGVADSLEMGLEAADKATIESLVEGKQAILRQLQTAMERHGVVGIDPLGAPFDPELHEAISMQPSNTAEPGSVLTVVQRGYTLNGRLLRPARVVVAKAPD